MTDSYPLAERGSNPRVWLRAFWGFSPEDEGYLGFTNEGNRTRFLNECQDGDLVLIYGADNTLTRVDQRRQLLGFLEIEPRPITDIERSSDNDRRWREENGFLDRWTFALPAKKAWRINRRVEAQHFVPDAFNRYQPILIASRGELLNEDEAERVLQLPVTPADVFGMPPLPMDQKEAEFQIQTLFRPSRGFTPSFGKREYEIEDAENSLYVLELQGSAAAFLGRQPYETAGKSIIKIGLAKDPQVRCETHNKHLPPACAFKWKLMVRSEPFPGAITAKEAEDSLKERFGSIFFSLGGEFFLADTKAIFSEFTKFAPARNFIRAAPATR